jgi:hypothetical protein
LDSGGVEPIATAHLSMISVEEGNMKTRLQSVWSADILPLILVILSVAVFLVYLVPEWRAFFVSDVFVFTNGWDEEFYLSWQGALGFKNSPGYFPLHLVLALQKIGLSGAFQNLILDTLLPPATALIVALSLKILKVDSARAVAYATLICFGSVLFNACNPLIDSLLGDPRSATIPIMAAWEVYPSILRTPNPEIPFFLIACAVYGYLRFDRWWILILPLPLLYYFTAVPYLFVLVLSFLYQQLRLRYFANPAIAMFTASAMTFVMAGVGLVGLSYFMGFYQPDQHWRQNSYVFSATRSPQLPAALIALTVVFLLGALSGLLRINRRTATAIWILGIASVGSVNLHIFTGFMLSQKNYYDYGLSITLAVLAVILIDSIRFDFAKHVALMATLLVISLFSYQSHRHWIRTANELSTEMSPSIDKLRVDPLHAVIPKTELAARVGFSTPLLLAPFSNLYYYFEMSSQCSSLPVLVANIMTFSNARLPAASKELAELSNTVRFAEMYRQRFGKSTKPDYSYCAAAGFENKDFYFVRPGAP